MAEIREFKRPDWCDPRKGLQNLLEDWKSGATPVPASAAVVTILPSGEVEVYGYGDLTGPLHTVGALVAGQHALFNLMSD